MSDAHALISSPPNTTSTAKPHPLYPLPTKIRHIIYAYAFAPSSKPYHTTLKPNPTIPPPRLAPHWLPYWLPPIYALNRATYLDVGWWMLSAFTFNIQLQCADRSLDQFSAFLATFPGTSGFAAIRRILVLYFNTDLRTHDVAQRASLWNFLGRCNSLRELGLQFRMMNLLKSTTSCWDLTMTDPGEEDVDETSCLRSLEDLVRACGLNSLFEVPMDWLRTMVLEEWPVERSEERITLKAMPLMEELAGYLREGFRERGRDVDVVIRGEFTLGVRWGNTFVADFDW